MINRPAAANAINAGVTRGLVDGLTEAMADDSILAVILTGAGNRVFCAGRDLKNPLNLDPDALNRTRRDESIAYNEALMAFDKPLVVALNGAAIGAGLMLALHADQVVAAEHALLSLPEIDIGIPTILGHTLIAELAGHSVANDLVLTGRRLSAAEAQQRGLVHHVVQGSSLLDEAEACARFLGAKPRSTFRAVKRWILQRRQAAVRAAFAAHAELDLARGSA
jgi:enoyl-CoA hydratase/carnithine racemase